MRDSDVSGVVIRSSAAGTGRDCDSVLTSLKGTVTHALMGLSMYSLDAKFPYFAFR